MDTEGIDLASIDWQGTAENLHRELLRYQLVIRAYVEHVEDGEKFGALVELVERMVSDDGMYGG